MQDLARKLPMPTTRIALRNVPGTRAAMGWAGHHTIVVDRPDGRAGGMGLGFNGAELLALALGGCFCNDLRYVAAEAQVDIAELTVQVDLDMEGEPLVAKAARMQVRCRLQDGSDPAGIIEKARSSCMVSNSLSKGVEVRISSL